MVMESLQRLDPPQALGKLTLLARLGEGGMATVYVAAMGQGSLARLCAVKLLRAGAPDVDYRTRFVDEAKVVVRLHHNNLVDVREAGEQQGQLFIVMELCEGRDLADVWDRCAEVGKAFPVALAVHIVREALRGLHYAHTFPGLGLVHRDISPSNLLIDWAGAVRVADFGLATSVLKATNTMPGMVFGKVGYMAPEQATRGDVDPRADVYGCGVVLWELLTGRPLRESGVDTRTVAKFAAHPPSMLSRRVDPDLDAIVVCALETRPEDRFEDAGAFMRALSEWLGANAPHTTQETLSEFMRLLFADVQIRDHAEYGALLESLAHPVTGVFRRVDTHETTREIPPMQLSEELSPGVVVAERYRIEQTLGRGGMGTVYLAEHVTVGRKVAVKVLTHEWSGHDVVARRFKEEARAASAAGHPNIVEVFDAGRLPDNRLYLVMEHLVGRSLYEELTEGGRMEMHRAVGIVREITRAVGAAHSVGIIHRDLKPDNVMLVTRGGEVHVKVLDFGISASAERAAEDRRLTQPGHALGTPEYMAPEQAKGRPPNERVDIYALGVIAYELLAGEPPFVSENFVEVLARKATEPAPPLDRTRDDLPPALVRLVHDCLEIEPTRRPASAAELLARLDDALAITPEPVAMVPFELTQSPRPDRQVQVVRMPPSQRLPALPQRPIEPVRPWMWLGAIGLLMIGAIGLWELRPARFTAPWLEAEVEPAAVVQRGDEPPLADAREPQPVDEAPRGEGGTPVPTVDAKVPPVVDDAKVQEEPQLDPVEPVLDAKVVPKKTAPKPSPIETEACRDQRAATEAARRGHQWSTMLANLSSSRCWTGAYRGTAVALKVKALYELGNWTQCARVGASASDAATKALVRGCQTRLADNG